MYHTALKTALSSSLWVMVISGPAGAILPPAQTGNLYVSNFAGDNIGVYDPSGAFLRTFTHVDLDGPRGIVFAPDGRIYVANQHGDEVFVFDEMDQLVDRFSHVQLTQPTGMALSNDDLLYVSSFDGDRVVVFDLDGTFVRTFTGGGLNGPASGNRLRRSGAHVCLLIQHAHHCGIRRE